MDDHSSVDDLERRVAALEAAARNAASAPPASPATPPDAGTPTALATLRHLEELRSREGPRYVSDDVRGALTYAGSAQFGDREVLWAGEHGLPEVWDLDPAAVARLLAALGHPTRLALVRALIPEARTSQELQALIGGGSAGQLYHHLKDLIAAGVVDQTARSCYRIAGGRIMPLLVILAAAGDVARAPEED